MFKRPLMVVAKESIATGQQNCRQHHHGEHESNAKSKSGNLLHTNFNAIAISLTVPLRSRCQFMVRASSKCGLEHCSLRETVPRPTLDSTVSLHRVICWRSFEVSGRANRPLLPGIATTGISITIVSFSYRSCRSSLPIPLRRWGCAASKLRSRTTTDVVNMPKMCQVSAIHCTTGNRAN